MNAATPTRVLQFLRTLLHIVLGASIGEDHQHLRHVPPHAAVRGEDFLVDVLQSNAWRGRGHTTVSDMNQFFSKIDKDGWLFSFFFAVAHLSWCCLLCSAQISKQI